MNQYFKFHFKNETDEGVIDLNVYKPGGQFFFVLQDAQKWVKAINWY